MLVPLLLAASAPSEVFAQAPPKVWRIGFLDTTAMTRNVIPINAFRRGMQQLGYAEGRNYVLEYRSARRRQ